MTTVPPPPPAAAGAFASSASPAPTAVPTPPVTVRTTRIDPHLVPALLDALPAGDDPRAVVSWVRRGEGLVGWGRVLEHRGTGATRFADARDWWRALLAGATVHDEVAVPGTGPVAFGSVAYSTASAHESVLVVPQVVLGRRGDDAWVTTVRLGATAGAEGTDALPGPQPAPCAPVAPRLTEGVLGSDAYAAAVARAVEQIAAGRVEKVVLARDVRARAAAPVDVRWLLQRLAQRYGSTWVFAVDGLVGATPELLVRLERGLVTSRVLAGTIRRTGDEERDAALAGSLARSSKDLEEHEYAVRSVADALDPHTSSMNVPESPFVLHLSNVMHLATDVTAVAGTATDSLGLAEALHPSAAVCGTPTAVADGLLAELEGMDRGRYAGPVGWMDARGDGEWGIALRCGGFDRDDAHALTLWAGCGIVAGSDPASEVAESEAKFLPMREALGA